MRAPILAVTVALIACADGASPPEAPPQKLVPATLVKITGDAQIALIGTAVPIPPTVEVRTSSGAPVPGTVVSFSTSGIGSASPTTVTTDANGRASTTWTLASFGGTNLLTATADNVPPVEFTALASAPAAKLDAVTQTPLASVLPVAVPLTVVATDANSNLVFNTVVTFSIASGAGTLSSTNVLSSALGVATSSFTPSAAGAASITARLATATGTNTTVNFSLNSVASVALAAQTTQNFSAIGGEVRAVTIRATSGGGAVANLPVTFAVSSNGGTITISSARTNSSGDASTSWTMPASSGTHRVTASAGGQSVVFTASVTYDPNTPAVIAPTFGDSVWVQPGTTQTIVAKVSNGANSGLSGIPVTFSTTAAGAGIGATFIGPFSQSVTINTASGGAATAYFKVGPTVGTYVATATAASLPPASFRVYAANPGAPKTLDPGHGSGAAVPTTTTATISPSVRVLDEHGIPVPNVDVTWTVTAGDGLVRTINPPVEATSVIVKTSATGSNSSSAGFRAPPTPGNNTITASVPGVTPLTFTIASTVMSVCSGITSYTLGTSVNGTLSTSDCTRYYDLGPPYKFYYMDAYRVTLTQTTIVDVTLAASYAPRVHAATEARHLRTGFGSPATVRLILPPGTHYLGASSSDQEKTGTYTLSSTLSPDLSTGPAPVVARGINATLNVKNSSAFSNAPYNALRTEIFLWPGEQVTVEMRSSNFDAFLGIYGPSATWLATDDNSGGGTDARIVFTAPSSGTYAIYAGTATNVVPSVRGFTLTIP